MATRTAVIDIGSNSIRMAIFHKSSRFAFHIIHEAKSKAKLSSNLYKNNTILQDDSIYRGEKTIGEFLTIAKNYKVRKILCVATSALRDASNASAFLSIIKQKYKLDIKIISGERESYYCALACANLLPKIPQAVTIDIGGGSCEFALLHENKIQECYSLDLGTIRINELFLDNGDINGAIKYIDEQLSSIPFKAIDTAMGVGGSFRALAKSITKEQNYPIKKLHGFSFEAKELLGLIKNIQKSDTKKLKALHIKPDRLDTIKSGALILERIIFHLGIKNLITSGVGVREGLFLNDMLRNHHGYMPHNFNPSVKNLLDRFSQDPQIAINRANLTKKIFELTHTYLYIDISYKQVLTIASKLMDIGGEINFYSNDSHSSYIALYGLNYGLTHSDIALISQLLLFKKQTKLSDIKNELSHLLPEKKVLNTLHFILWCSHAINKSQNIKTKLDITFDNGVLYIKNAATFLATTELEDVIFPENFSIVFK